MAAGESCKTRETHAESDWFFVGERSVPLAAFKVAFLSSVSELKWTWSEPRKIVCQICVRVNRTCSQPVRAKLRITLSWDCALYKIQLTSFCSQTQPFCFQLTSSGFFANSIFRLFGEAFLTQTAIIMPRARFWRAFLISFLAIYHKKLILRIYWPSRISCQPKTCALHYAEFWNIISIIITFVEEDDFYFSVRAKNDYIFGIKVRQPGKPAACVHR